MAETKTLKEKNAPLIWAYLLLQIAVFLLFVYGPPEPLSAQSLAQVDWHSLTPATLGIGIVAFVRLILLGLIPSKLRDHLVHGRWVHPLPGSRAFSDIGVHDPRVSIAAVEAKYGPLPSDGSLQDQKFYALYSEFRDDPGVLDAHRNYLAVRDITTLNLLLAIPLPLVLLGISGDLRACVVYACGLIALHLVGIVVVRNYSNRLVANVLAVASASAQSAGYGTPKTKEAI